MKKNNRNNQRNSSVFAANIGAVHMDISGNREVVFEGNKGVVEYNENSIKINTGKYIVGFNGRGLHIKCMSGCDVVIHGFITSIEYIM